MDTVKEMPSLQDQIDDLRTTSVQNSAQINDLGAQLKNALGDLQKADAKTDERLQKAIIFLISATILIAIIVNSLYAYFIIKYGQ